MKAHRFDPISLLLGIVAITIGISAINGRLGTLVNNRPDALVPLIILSAGLLAISVAARRGLSDRDATPSFQDVDGAGDDQHHRAE